MKATFRATVMGLSRGGGDGGAQGGPEREDQGHGDKRRSPHADRGSPPGAVDSFLLGAVGLKFSIWTWLCSSAFMDFYLLDHFHKIQRTLSEEK